jgi:hypothetical protein
MWKQAAGHTTVACLEMSTYAIRQATQRQTQAGRDRMWKQAAGHTTVAFLVHKIDGRADGLPDPNCMK